jgi:transposase
VTRTLSQWCKHQTEQREQAFPGSGHQLPQEEEVRRLKRELEVVRQERDLVKKALAIFSRSPSCNSSSSPSRRMRTP